MVLGSPTNALGSHARGVRDVVVDVVRSRHDRAAEAHDVSASRFSTGFASQWRDLLVDAQAALVDRGYQSHRLTPAGYDLPVVNGCLVYVWRVPGTADPVSRFASSSTRKNGFTARPPDPMLFEPGFAHEAESQEDAADEESRVEAVVRAAGDTMPLVLIMVHSSPRQLQSIEWAIAVLDDTGKVTLYGREAIWEPGLNVTDPASHVESFDSGTPLAPPVEPLRQEGSRPDA